MIQTSIDIIKQCLVFCQICSLFVEEGLFRNQTSQTMHPESVPEHILKVYIIVQLIIRYQMEWLHITLNSNYDLFEIIILLPRNNPTYPPILPIRE